MVAMVREKRAGYWNMVNEISLWCLPRTEKPAPIIGPNMNPREKATPINACVVQYIVYYIRSLYYRT